LKWGLRNIDEASLAKSSSALAKCMQIARRKNTLKALNIILRHFSYTGWYPISYQWTGQCGPFFPQKGFLSPPLATSRLLSSLLFVAAAFCYTAATCTLESARGFLSKDRGSRGEHRTLCNNFGSVWMADFGSRRIADEFAQGKVEPLIDQRLCRQDLNFLHQRYYHIERYPSYL
jgi:hypothetical protein